MACKNYAITFPVSTNGKKGPTRLKECGRISWNRFVVSVPVRATPLRPHQEDKDQERHPPPLLMMAPCETISPVHHSVSVVSTEQRRISRPETANFPARPPLSGSMRTRAHHKSPTHSVRNDSCSTANTFSRESRTNSAKSRTMSPTQPERYCLRGVGPIRSGSVVDQVNSMLDELTSLKSGYDKSQAGAEGGTSSTSPALPITPEPGTDVFRNESAISGEVSITVFPYRAKYQELYNSPPSQQGMRPLPAIVRQLLATNQATPSHKPSSSNSFFHDPLPRKNLTRKSTTARLFVGSTIMKRPQTPNDSQPEFIFPTRMPPYRWSNHTRQTSPTLSLDELQLSSTRENFWNVTAASSSRSSAQFH